ncbi:PspC domain-containing protein [Nocardioides sp. cx-169]|uniref:PspC domain-containing protein n=1 Tax=Nocardioides sp. cx-169 TaxID=2899080 RepID=UPI001E5D313A|nr:PspC domain-containing protein [Nocardioides sp. cx-169]MCD4532861.1 PspC domain-containing protein [Nocardioides sp. cx-169]
MNTVSRAFARQGLVRPRGSRILGGVCAGIARRLGMGEWTARLLFVLVLMVLPGSQILVYPILWILMPSEDQVVEAPRPPAPGGPLR